MRLLDRVQRAAADTPDVIAVVSDARALTYRALHQAARGLAITLGGNYPRPSTLLLVTGNDPNFFIWFLGALGAGFSVLPVSRGTPAAEVRALQARVNAVAVFDTAAPLPDDASTFADRAAAGDLLLTTSGSTAAPKVVVRDAESLDAVAANMAEAIGHAPGARVLAAVSLAHSYGLEHGLLAPLWAGASVQLIDGMDVSLLARGLAMGIDFLPAVPAMIEGLAGLPYTPRPPRVVYSAGAPLPSATAARFAERFGVACGQVYGMTEIGSVTYNNAAEPGFDPLSVGRAMGGVELSLLSRADTGEGELAVKAPSMLRRYIDGPAPLRDGRFITGDLATLDAAGRLTITGRTTMLIETAGRKVNPLEVEAVLQQHPAVAACVVLPLRQTETVCRLRAVIELRPYTDRPAVDELRAFVRQRLAPHKVPRAIEFRDALPRSATGKILRNQLECME